MSDHFASVDPGYPLSFLWFFAQQLLNMQHSPTDIAAMLLTLVWVDRCGE